MRNILIAFYLVVIFFFSISCNSISTIKLPKEICNQNLNTENIKEFYDSHYNFTFRYFEGFVLTTKKSDSIAEFSAISNNGTLEHSIIILDLDENLKNLKEIDKHLSNDSTKVINKQWRNLYGFKINQHYDFTNGIAIRKINDSTRIKGLIAIDVYQFEKSNRVVIVKAVDFCKTTSSNNIEPIFSLNREPDL